MVMGKPIEVGVLNCILFKLPCSGISRFQIYHAASSEAFLPQFPKVEKASTEEVDAAHKQYMAALASLYLKHNTDENVSLVIT